MKKLLITAAAAICVFGGMAARAEIIGAVYTTDIGALIDGCPIKSYNISDSTYIKAEDLRGYGFDVAWDENARTLKITPDDNAARTVPSAEEINTKKSDIPFNQKLYDVYSTDIKTYVNGAEIHACNIDGETLVKFRDLESVAYVNYDDSKRLASIDVISKRLDDELSVAEGMTDLTLSDGVTYHGQVKDGKPDGIGVITDKSADEDRVNNIVTIAHFTDGEKDGIYRTDGTYEVIRGSSLGTYIDRGVGNTKVNYSVSYSDYHMNPDTLYCCISTLDYDKTYSDSTERATGTECRAQTDDGYLYGIKNTDIYEYTTVTDGDYNIAPEDGLPKFDRFAGDYGANAVTEDGTAYTLPYGPDYVHAVAVPESDTDSDKYIENGILYEDMHDGNAPRVVDTDVKAFDGESYVIYLKNDGSAWVYRSNSKKALGYGWIDGEDLSAPVKCADDVAYVSSGDGLTMAYIKNDGSVYVLGVSYNGEKGVVETRDNGIDYTKFLHDTGVKMGDGFVSCSAGSEVVLALKENGDLYAWGANNAGVIDKDGGGNVLTPMKVAEDVRDYIYDGALYIIKTDDTLWYRGRTRHFSDRQIEGGIPDFTMCGKVYREVSYKVGE